MKKYGGAKTKTQKTREICEQENKDFNTVTKRCLKKCVSGKERGENFRCKTTRKNRAICERENKDFNLYTERCVKKCAPGKERDATFKCKKIRLPTSAVEVPNISRKDATDLLNFVAQLEEVGRKYEKTGIYYPTHDLLEMIMYNYLIAKYNASCFIYGYIDILKEQPYQSLTINISKFGLLGNDFFVGRYQKYVYKMIMLILNCIMKIKDTQEEIIIIPLTIYESKEPSKNIISHSNMLIYRKTLNVIEHYEPYGKEMPIKGDTNKDVNKILNVIVNKMNKINKTNNNRYFSNGDIKYMPPSNICPHNKGFQTIESELILPQNINKKEKGFCTLWSLFFAEMTLANPQFSSKEIFDYIFNNIHHNGLKTKTIIRGYLEIIYDKVINIIRDINKVNLENNISFNKIGKIISSEKFKKKYEDIVNEIFKKNNNKNIIQYFKEPNSAEFETLSPSQINSKYTRGMMDSP